MNTESKESNCKRIFGLDLSKKTFKYCLLTKEKNFEDRKILTGSMEPEGRMAFAAKLREGDCVVMEGGTSSFNFAREILANTKAEVIVLNPTKLHIIFQSQVKTDKQDAAKIANYVRDTRRSNWCTVQVPSEGESRLRQIINSYNYAVKERTRHINKLYAIFNQNGFPAIKKSSLASNEGRITMIEAYLSDYALEDACMTEREITNAEDNKKRYVAIMKEILIEKYSTEAAILLSIPGIGTITAATMIAYIGDGSRFYSAAQLRNYVALIPRIDQSGEHKYIGKVSSYGCKPIRKCIVQAALSTENLASYCPLVDEWAKLRAAKKTKQKMAVHMANKLLTIAWTLLRKKELYNGFGNNNRLKRKLKIEKLDRISLDQFEKKEMMTI